MITIRTSVVIHSTIEEAFTFRARFENDPQWWSGVIETRRISEHAQGVGTEYRDRFRMPFSPIVKNPTFWITKYIPNKCIALAGTSDSVSFRSHYMFEPVAESVTDHTRVTIEIELPMPRWLKPFEAIITQFWLRETRRNLNTLKTVIETQVTRCTPIASSKRTDSNLELSLRHDALHHPAS